MSAPQWVLVKRESELKPGDELRPARGDGICGACGDRHSVTLVEKRKHKKCTCSPDCRAPGWTISGGCSAMFHEQYCLRWPIRNGNVEKRVEVAAATSPNGEP
jgi:hypothetical protein